MSRSRITIREVASRAGVSHQTVSRVINNSERVNPETRRRVEQAIAELGYTPNAIARIMARGKPSMLACISPNLTDFTFASIIEGAENEARQHGYFLLAASAPDEEEFRCLVEQLVDSRRTEGLIVMNPYADGRYRFLPKHVPIVFIGAHPRGEAVDSVYLDEEAAGHCATAHLIGLGHRRIAMITGPLGEDCSQDRQTGYQKALVFAGLPFDSAIVIEGDWSASSGYQAVDRLFTGGHTFSAIFAQNDRMAVGAIQAIRGAGKSVPQDVSVIGFDDMPLASYFDPPLTTMRQDTFRMGREATRLLLSAVEDFSSASQHLSLPVELIIRGSTSQYLPRR
jgi:LacI family repressor for deo operon, udp, cdd, tsx, nupC, and nupG